MATKQTPSPEESHKYVVKKLIYYLQQILSILKTLQMFS